MQPQTTTHRTRTRRNQRKLDPYYTAQTMFKTFDMIESVIHFGHITPEFGKPFKIDPYHPVANRKPIGTSTTRNSKHPIL